MEHEEEGDSEVVVESSTEPQPPYLRLKDADPPPHPHPPETRNVSQDPAVDLPDSFLEVLMGKGSTNHPEITVEELTLTNYISPNSSTKGDGGGGDPSGRRGLWTTGAQRPPPLFRPLGMDSSSDVTRHLHGSNHHPPSSGFPQFKIKSNLQGKDISSRNQQAQNNESLSFGFPQFNIKGNLKGKGITSRSQEAQNSAGNQLRTQNNESLSFGFPQFNIKGNLKRKEVSYPNQEAQNFASNLMRSQNIERMNGRMEIDSGSSHKPGGKRDGKALYGGGGIKISDVTNEGTTLREWLKQREHKFNKAERLNFFRQIVDLVDTAHSQGLALKNLRPSYFLILPVNLVKYIGSLVPEGQLWPLAGSTDEDIQNLEHCNSKRKGYMQPETGVNLSLKHQRLGENNQIAFQHNFQGSFKTRNSESDYKRHLKLGESYYAGNKSQRPAISSFGCELSKSEIMKLEGRWYASPEELNESICFLSSNIYHLGVLLFELFNYFDTREMHYASMSDLHNRILPPNFLSENPQEASFCHWLLHPEPTSRPKSRDILMRGLVWEGRDISSLDQSSASLDEEDAETDLLLHFLLNSKERKENQAAKLAVYLGCLQADIKEVKKRHSSSTRDLWTNSNDTDIDLHREPIHVETMSRLSISSTNKDRLMRNIDQLEKAYVSMRSRTELSETNPAARSDKDVLNMRDKCFQGQNDADASTDRLGTFFEGLCKYARYSRFEVCGTLRNVDILKSTNVIRSLSFDRDEEYFAAAGVSKKIKVFEFNSLLNDSVDIHYPLIEMSGRSMLSCVCWNNYIKNYLASTDYDGVVQLWDASTGQGFTQYTEHQKRAWSVDFCQTDPIKLASGSDDCSVKLWSINERNCISTIRNMANICCVKFSSYSSHLLVYGSVDHKIYCYDLRNTRIPWCTLSGHGKAVSYVKFIDSETLVSASTDNTLKLWDLSKTNTVGLSTAACSLTFRGHTNEKNFVGLSVSDGYIACGSETNEVYSYYKTFPMPITSHKYGSVDPITGQDTGDDNGQFVSSVCWRTKSNMLVAANSSGSLKLLKLV